VKHLVILSFGASGTNALVDQLFNNDHVFVHKEKEPLNLNSKSNKDKGLKDGKITWVQKIESLIREAGNKKLLIHIKPKHLRKLGVSCAEAVDYLKDNFEFIFIERLNYLARQCSAEFKRNAKANKRATIRFLKTSTIAGSFPAACCMCLTSKFEEMTAINEELKDLIKNYNHICITYEDHIKPDPRIGSDIITRYFNIYHDYDYKRYINHYHAKKNKWSDIKLADKIADFDDLKKEFIGTKYEWMLWE
tara:strand:+ start:369 stop:1115 length:747 start_codon:yes stop_codon:yes gene_type:complete